MSRNGGSDVAVKKFDSVLEVLNNLWDFLGACLSPFLNSESSQSTVATLNVKGCSALDSRKWGQGTRSGLGLVYVEKIGTDTANFVRRCIKRGMTDGYLRYGELQGYEEVC